MRASSNARNGCTRKAQAVPGSPYVNGQDRSIAMRDQCVRVAPLIMTLPISTTAPAPAPAQEFVQDT